MKEKVNQMCLNCTRYKNGCKGETDLVYTGCIYKTVEKKEVVK